MIAFLNYAIKKNELVEATAVALRTGVKRVLETDDALPQAEVRSMDLDDVVRRFRNKYRGQFKDQSLNDYEKRFRQTAEMYVKWLDNDPSWRPAPRKASAPRRKAAEGASGAASGPAKPAQVRQNGSMTANPGASVPAGVTMVDYPYPVRPGLLAQISLPEDLTAKEAERVAKFVASLAFEERLAITAGPTQQELPAK